MKKTYINPTLKVVKVKPAQILAGSFKESLGTENVNGSAALGRESRFSRWEEDDFESEE